MQVVLIAIHVIQLNYFDDDLYYECEYKWFDYYEIKNVKVMF